MKIKDPVVKNKVNLLKILTKCSKMTEEGDLKRNGMNGASVTNSLSLTRNNSNIYNSNNHQKDGLSGSAVLHKNKLSSITENDSKTDCAGTTSASSSGSSGNNCNTQNNNSTFGGRLQFFKDGKFILELARARDGDRTGWVSVPRKTYWPPTAAPASSVNYHKNESSASLSFSDDNSSIQSSPWQRDHCWKQTSPRRSISKEMNFYLYRPAKFTIKFENKRIAKLKFRRPYDINLLKLHIIKIDSKIGIKKSSVVEENINNIDNDLDKDIKSDNVDDNDLTTKTDDKIKIKEELKDDDEEIETKPHLLLNDQPGKIQNSIKSINTVIQKLIEKKSSNLILVNTKGPAFGGNVSNYSKLDSNLQHVSPRKRILREFEKVSLEDSTMKRSRAKVQHINNGSSSCIITSTSVASVTITAATATISRSYAIENCSTKTSNGVTITSNHNELPITQPISRPISSYSINSLLGHNNDKQDNNISNSQQYSQQNISDPSHLRAMLSSPNSPEYRFPKYGFDKKKCSPPYNSGVHLSPKYSGTNSSNQANHNKSPSVNDTLSYGIARSPGLSPNPDQGYRYRSHASSSPNFHPYSVSSSSRCSPSDTISPTSDIYINRNRPGFMVGSPNHPSSISRQSPNSNYSPKFYNSKLLSSPTHHLNNLNITVNKIRETTSPRMSPNTDGSLKRETNSTPSTTTSSSASSSSPIARTVPKKTAAFRQQYNNSGVSSSPSGPMEHYYKTSNHNREITEISHKYDKEDRKRILNAQKPGQGKDLEYGMTGGNSNMSMGGDEIDSPNLPLRPSSHIPTPPFHQQSPHGMYLLHPSYHSSASASPPGSFLPYYHPMSYASAVQAAAYRNSMWMHYPGLSSSARVPSMLTFGGAGLEPHMHHSSTSTPWVPIPQPLNNDPVALVRIKDDPCTDVPLNLSKH